MINKDLLYENDGLFMSKVGNWSKTKHEKIGYYSSIFSASMKNKWDYRVYIDLFAGAGKSQVKDTGNIIPGSPLLALNVEVPFDKYIFCEKSTECFSALKVRVETYFPEKNIYLINGDCNTSLDLILAEIPKFSRKFRGLSLCFIDPYNMGDIKFTTIELIAKLYVDFLILIPTFMDIHRNQSTYTQANNVALDMYLGTISWREDWGRTDKRDFGLFIANYFCTMMKNLGYIYEGLKDLEVVKTNQNRPLYHLAFFSKHQRGLDFWRKAVFQTNPQTSIWE